MARPLRKAQSCTNGVSTEIHVTLPGAFGTLLTVGARTTDTPGPGTLQIEIYVARGLRQDRDPYGSGELTQRTPVRGETVTEYGPLDTIVVVATNNSGAAVTVEVVASVDPERVPAVTTQAGR